MKLKDKNNFCQKMCPPFFTLSDTCATVALPLCFADLGMGELCLESSPFPALPSGSCISVSSTGELCLESPGITGFIL